MHFLKPKLLIIKLEMKHDVDITDHLYKYILKLMWDPQGVQESPKNLKFSCISSWFEDFLGITKCSYVHKFLSSLNELFLVQGVMEQLQCYKNPSRKQQTFSIIGYHSWKSEHHFLVQGVMKQSQCYKHLIENKNTTIYSGIHIMVETLDNHNNTFSLFFLVAKCLYFFFVHIVTKTGTSHNLVPSLNH